MSDEKNKLKLYEKALCDECVDGPMGSCVNACVNKALTHDPRKGYEAERESKKLRAELERVKRELQKSEHDNVNLTGELAKVAAELERAREELKRHLICYGIDYALTDGLWKA